MLEAGKHVTTSNKALVADKGADLIKTAREHNVNFLFEASVGGGIPIIRPILECLTGDIIEEISGIVNGTTNYIMTKMTEDGSDFADVLKEAQELGYAEKDPTADSVRLRFLHLLFVVSRLNIQIFLQRESVRLQQMILSMPMLLIAKLSFLPHQQLQVIHMLQGLRRICCHPSIHFMR